MTMPLPIRHGRRTLRRLICSALLLRATQFVCTLLGLYAIAFTYISLSQMTHEKRLNEIERLLVIGLLDAESGERGYLLTDNPLFLDQYQAGIKALGVYEPVYRKALACSESKQLFNEVSTLLSLKRTEMQLTITTHDEVGKAAAVAMVRDLRGHSYTGEIYRLLMQIRTTEAKKAVPFELWHVPGDLDIHDPNRMFSRSVLMMRLNPR